MIATLCACLVIGLSAYVLSGGTSIAVVLSILAAVCGIGFISLAAGLYAQSRQVRGHMLQLRNDMRTSERSSREATNRTDYLAQQILDLRNRGEQINHTILSGFSELKTSYTALSDQMREMGQANKVYAPAPFGVGADKANAFGFGGSAQSAFDRGNGFAQPFTKPFKPQPANQFGGVGFVPPKVALAATEELHEDHIEYQTQGKQQAPSLVDRLLTSLEPIVDLFTSKTTHYKLHLGMMRDDGEEVPSETVLHHADRTGLRAGFDLHAARDALALLRRLRQRDAGLSIFLPIGAHTLQSEDTINRLIGLLSEHADVANGLVLEIPHAMLAGLSDLGLEGLAKLARGGHTLALSNVSTAGVDLQSLSKLNVRFVSLNVANAVAGDGLSKPVQQFASTARSLRVQMIVTHVSDQRMVAHISKITRFASGTAFAEPRRVRSDATASQPVSYSNVA
jgi:EAL domain-containing protein (putative c-di-GMP-specific phosphodiesterase class I)